MIKIIFLFFFISFSSFAEDIPCIRLATFDTSYPLLKVNPNSDWITITQLYPFLTAENPSYLKNCQFFSQSSFQISYTESSSDENVYYYTIFAVHSPSSVSYCPDGNFPFISPYRFPPPRFSINDYISPVEYSDYSVEQHNGCASDVAGWGGNVEEDCFFYLQANVPHKVFYYFFCPISDISLSSSQETATKKNDLLAESNSKLGVIASTNSAITGLLQQIKDTLLSLNSANFGIFGTGANSSDSANKFDPNSPEFEPTLSDSKINVSNILPLLSEIGSCPDDISIFVMNSTHYISYQPFCDFAERLRPLVIAAARVSAAWLVIGAL
jgi:hypothetical protein